MMILRILVALCYCQHHQSTSNLVLELMQSAYFAIIVIIHVNLLLYVYSYCILLEYDTRLIVVYY